jgi:NAD(P)-dependent dehydrogenase (short-subunit alcohol dehydrogenase family)
VSSPLQINPGVEASAVGFDLAGKRVFVAGHTGMAGSAIVRRLRQEPCNVLVAERSELDLTRQDQAEHYLSATRPDVVIMAAGRVGGILANDQTLRISWPIILPWSSIASMSVTWLACKN